MQLDQIKIPDISILRRIRALSALPTSQLIALANQLRTCSAVKNQLLLERGAMETGSLYIIKGSVSLSAIDGKTTVLNVRDDEEMKPVAQLRPCIYDVTAIKPTTYLKINKQTLINFTQLPETVSDDISVHTLFDEDEEDNSIIGHLYQNLMDNIIKLPSLPSVAERIQSIYTGKSTDLNAMTGILISYPDISRKLNNVARCSDRQDLSAKEKIRFSINRLGVRSIYCLIMIYAIGKLVRRLPLDHMKRVRSFWDHSLNVSAISRILAKNTGTFPPDLAMLAGLIHGVGVLIIDDQLLEHYHLMLDHIEIDHAIQAMRPEISSLLLRKWNLDDDLITVAEECGDWSRDKSLTADLCDLVLVANYFSLMKSDRNHSLPRVEDIPAMRKFEISPEEIIDTIKNSSVVVRNIKKLFI